MISDQSLFKPKYYYNILVDAALIGSIEYSKMNVTAFTKNPTEKYRKVILAYISCIHCAK